MRKSFLILIAVLLLFSLLQAQSKEIINKYRPTESGLYQTLDQGLKSRSVKYIKLLYNEKGFYSYTQKKSFNGKGKTVIFELYGDNPDIRLSMKNLDLAEFDKVIFNVFNMSEISIENCSFSNILNGVNFQFKEKLNGKKKKSNIVIKNCSFIDTDLKKERAGNFHQLRFDRNKYSKGLASLENVIIEDCSFIFNDPNKSWLLKSSYNTYPKRHSISFVRANCETAFSNITINNNKFEANAIYYRTEAITFMNNHNADFRTPKRLYNINRNIKVVNNRMKTNSDDPGHGIFIQGPYKDVLIDNNIIENFGMNMVEYNGLNCDGAIHLYGARNSKYSDDFLDATISNNKILAMGIALKVNGVHNAVIKGNKIKMLPWPKFYKNSTYIYNVDRIGIKVASGAYNDIKKQSSNVSVSNNLVDCNYEKACVGIVMQSTNNFKIIGNRIINPTNYGIFVFGHKGEANLNIGKSLIEKNRIDFGTQSKSSLSTKFYKVDFAAIKVHRMDNGKKYKNESLTIENNKVIDNSNTIPKLSVVDKTKSQLRKNTKSDVQIEN